MIAIHPMCRLIKRQSVQEPPQLPGTDHPHLGFIFWPAEALLFQPFVPETKPVAILIKDLHRIPLAITETKQVAG